MEFLGQLVFVLSCIIIVIAHGMTTYQSIKHINNSETDIDKLLEKLYRKNNFFNHPINLGVAWRLINEWKNIKKVANLDFKNKENEV